jgi:hypothetical protein
MDLRTLDDEPVLLSAALVTAWPLLKGNITPERPPGELALIDLQGAAEPATREGFGERWVLLYAEAPQVPP